MFRVLQGGILNPQFFFSYINNGYSIICSIKERYVIVYLINIYNGDIYKCNFYIVRSGDVLSNRG